MQLLIPNNPPAVPLDALSIHICNGHYNRTPDLGKYWMWWNAWDLAIHDTRHVGTRS